MNSRAPKPWSGNDQRFCPSNNQDGLEVIGPVSRANRSDLIAGGA